jgi:hypothetical protein
MIKIPMTQTTAGFEKIIGFFALRPCFGHLEIRISNLFRISMFEFRIYVYMRSELISKLGFLSPDLYKSSRQMCLA